MGWGVFQMQCDDGSVRYGRTLVNTFVPRSRVGVKGLSPVPGNSNYDASLALSLRLCLLHRQLTHYLCCFVGKDSGGYNRDTKKPLFPNAPPPDFLGYT